MAPNPAGCRTRWRALPFAMIGPRSGHDPRQFAHRWWREPHSVPDLPMRCYLPFLSFAVLILLTQCAELDPVVRRFASDQVSTNTSDADTAAALISQYR